MLLDQNESCNLRPDVTVTRRDVRTNKFEKRFSSINDFKHKIKEFYFEEFKKNMNLNKRP